MTPKRKDPIRKPAIRRRPARRRRNNPRMNPARGCLRLFGPLPGLTRAVVPACATCGEIPEQHLHIPLRVAGAFCPKCCPICNSREIGTHRTTVSALEGEL